MRIVTAILIVNRLASQTCRNALNLVCASNFDYDAIMVPNIHDGIESELLFLFAFRAPR
jgi:hypothetical protein